MALSVGDLPQMLFDDLLLCRVGVTETHHAILQRRGRLGIKLTIDEDEAQRIDVQQGIIR